MLFLYFPHLWRDVPVLWSRIGNKLIYGSWGENRVTRIEYEVSELFSLRFFLYGLRHTNQWVRSHYVHFFYTIDDYNTCLKESKLYFNQYGGGGGLHAGWWG